MLVDTDSSVLPISVNKLDLGPIPAPCLRFIEARFREDGLCSFNKDDINMKIEEFIKQIDFNDMDQKLRSLFYDEWSCTRRKKSEFKKLQLKKERTELIKNLNTLKKSKLKQVNKNKKDIFKLNTKKKQIYWNLEKTKKYLSVLNKEFAKNKDIENKTSLDNYELQIAKELKLNAEEILFQETRCYNNGLKKLNESRNKLESLLKKMSQKNMIYNSLVCQLDKASKLKTSIKETALKSQEERDEALKDLKQFQNTMKVDDKQWKEKLYITKDKLLTKLDINEFISKKSSMRLNRSINLNDQIKTSDIEVNEDQNKEGIEFIKYLINIVGNKDLKKCVNNIEKMSYDKESLFRLIILFELQFAELENSINKTQNIEIERNISNNNRNKTNELKIKTYLEKIQEYDEILNQSQEFTNYIKNFYNELCDKIYSIFQALKINTSCMNELEINDSINEDNILNYIKAIENKSVELLYKVNYIENRCLTEPNEDTLTSDAESTNNVCRLKDYDGIEIKKHRFLNLEDSSVLPVPVNKLDLGPIPTPCLRCIETKFREDEVSSFNKDDINKELEEFINQIDFNDMNPKFKELLHDEWSCIRRKNL